MKLPEEIYDHYREINEDGRLDRVKGILEFERSKQIIKRYLNNDKMKILDIGGATGKYSYWLANLGHEVTLIDPMPNLIEIAKKNPKSSILNAIDVGDVRNLKAKEGSYDLIICFGPFYHLTDLEQRKNAFSELFRTLKSDGILLSAGISKYVSFVQSGLFDGMIEVDEFKTIIEQDLIDGQHRNIVDNTSYFTTSIFMEPKQLTVETQNAGFTEVECMAVEGPGWLHKNLSDVVNNQNKLRELMTFIEKIEKVESIMGISTHFIVKGKKPVANNVYKK
jgi:ubiquinone/menaquinone biosynthesis C-methylase UbiE